jgi:hypothetical protein
MSDQSTEGNQIQTSEQKNSDDQAELAASYFDCGTRDKIHGLLHKLSFEEEVEGLDEPLEFSDLSDPTRHMWIVTTAALPWRTGTSINPFLRALYFVRRRLDLYKNYDSEGDSDEMVKPGKITLVIPWLVDLKETQKLCGDHITETGEKGKEQQKDWIKNYADEMCGMKEEMEYLNICFYDAAYWTAFGSIFPTVDICNLIPSKEADIAILEEPEHLNWMRVPDIDVTADSEDGATDVESLSEEGDANKEALGVSKNKGTKSSSTDLIAVGSKDGDAASTSSHESKRNDSELGWSHKFRFVVGIIHTNYSAYMKQYGIGTTIVGAPVINMLSSVVVRAYCHKVIRLSGVIPSYAKWKEVTCNVHGVRGDFLEKPANSNAAEDEHEDYAPIYFIGKLLWAKGFDRMLKVQEAFRKADPQNKYFPIDIYGGGPDELEIKRAFHGRIHSNASEDGSLRSSIHSSEDSEEENVFSGRSIRDDLLRLSKSTEQTKKKVPKAFKNAKDYINAGFEVLHVSDDEMSSPGDDIVLERRKRVDEMQSQSDMKGGEIANPISILNDVSEKTISTGIATTKAVKNLADSALKVGLAMTFTQDELGDESDHGDNNYRFDPPKTLFEFRNTPIPARFLGVKDHASLLNSPHKIFLNPSITEVLCTTTAEALAMGKFVIIPRHVSNEFFFQFTNCLPYASMKECLKNIQWALENDPTPLSEKESHIFTWDAATDRMIGASIVTVREARDRSRSGRDKGDSRMAWIHSQSGKNGSFIKNAFFGQTDTKSKE